MQILRYAVVLIVGLAAGWLIRDQAVEETKERGDRRDTPVVHATVPASPADANATAPDSYPSRSVEGVPDATEPNTEPEGETTTDGAAGGSNEDEADDPLAEMLEAQTPQWKAWASMQVKQRVGGLFDGLGLDPETQKAIEEMLLKEAERQVDRTVAMMLGKEELDEDAFEYFFGIAPDLSPEVERELGTFLSDDEIAGVRGRVQETYKKQMNDMADMQIGQMSIGDLSDDQRTRMREVFAGRNQMKEQFTDFAKMTRNRDTLNQMLTGGGEGVAEYMEQGFEKQRTRVREILTPEQYKKYDAYEKNLVKQAEMGVRMMAGMLKQKSETSKPAGK